MSMSSIRLDALELSFSPYTLVGDANVFDCLDALELSLAHDALVSNATVLYCGAFFFSLCALFILRRSDEKSPSIWRLLL